MRICDELFSSSGGIGVVEAGTGLGKSMAYLYPAIKLNNINDDKDLLLFLAIQNICKINYLVKIFLA
ncbi:MAG: hypothetical protein CM1200mP1_11510 [Candidatus Neomarinimicrobiota bacterium]|nr:MAG: hypothetical protein CM1200mP1_11510 [Candidatus Neomarinimicrobiota bacterium]